MLAGSSVVLARVVFLLALDVDVPAARPANVQIGFHLGWAMPHGELGAAIGPAAGMVFNFAYRPASFLAVGAELGYFRYGWSHHQERFRLVAESGGEIPLVRQYSRKNDLVPALLTARLQLPIGTVRPYVEGLLGLTIFKTIVDIDQVSGDEDDVIDSWAPVAGTRGVEVGVDVRLSRRRYPQPAHDASLFLSLGVRRLQNSEATVGVPGPLAAGFRQSPSTFTVITLGFTGRADLP